MAKDITNDTIENKPYMRYRITSTLPERGAGFSIKRAVNAYLTAQGFSGRVTDFVASNDNFEAIVEIFDNGNYRFDPTVLRDHILKSGRLPTDRNIRPGEKDIEIRSLPCDAVISVLEKSKDQIGYEKSLEQFQKRIVEGEATIQSLTESLAGRQKAINQIVIEKNDLERRLANSAPKVYDTPENALSNCYFTCDSTILLESAIDLDRLQKDGLLGLFTCNGNAPVAYAAFLNNQYKTQFENDSAVDKWKELMKKTQTWEDTQEAKKLEEERKRLATDEEVLSLAREKGASSEVLALLDKTIAEEKLRYETFEAGLVDSKSIFDSQRQLYSQLDEVRAKYEEFRDICERSRKRTEKNIFLEGIVGIQTGSLPSISVVIPALVGLDPIEGYVHSLVSEFEVPNVKVQKTADNESVKFSISYASVSMADSDLRTRGRKLVESFIRDSLFRELGIKMKLITLEETKTPENAVRSLS